MAEIFSLDDARKGLRKTTVEEMQGFATKMTDVLVACVTSSDRKAIVDELQGTIPELLANAQDKKTILEALGRIYDAFEATMPTKTHADLAQRPRAERMFILGIDEMIRALNEDSALLPRQSYTEFITERLETIRSVAVRPESR